jgi:DNA polymerase-4
VTCSVGLAGDKTTAKYAAKLHKPDGFTVIPPWRAREALRNVPVTELCGINKGIGDFLAARGVITCGDMARLPIGELARRFGNPGRRIWLMCQGRDSEPVRTEVPPPKSLGHGKVMPPDTRDPRVLRVYLLHMSEKVGARLRRHAMVAQTFFIGLSLRDGWLADHYRSETPTDDGRLIYRFARRLLADHWRGEGVFQVQVRALDPRPADGQLGLFDAPAERPANTVMDAVNARYGEFALAPATLLGRSDMPNVIAPSWKPFGHRETIRYQAIRQAFE